MRTRVEKVVEAGDGTLLYARETRGPAASGAPIICANGIGVSTFFWKYVERDFSAERPVIVWDYRGHGASEWPRDLDDLTMEAMADDMLRVLGAFGHSRGVLLGHSMGCQVIYTFAHRHPAAAGMLVPMLGTYGRPVHTFLGGRSAPANMLGFIVGHTVATRLPDPIARGQRRLLAGKLGRRLVSRFARLSGLVDAVRMPQSDLEDYLDHFGAFSPLIFFRMAEHMATHTADPWLEQLEAPTLVVAGERDLFTPMAMSEEAARRLPRARLLVLREGSHAALVEQPDVIHAAMREFMREYAVDGAPTEAPPAPAPAGA